MNDVAQIEAKLRDLIAPAQISSLPQDYEMLWYLRLPDGSIQVSKKRPDAPEGENLYLHAQDSSRAPAWVKKNLDTMKIEHLRKYAEEYARRHSNAPHSSDKKLFEWIMSLPD